MLSGAVFLPLNSTLHDAQFKIILLHPVFVQPLSSFTFSSSSFKVTLPLSHLSCPMKTKDSNSRWVGFEGLQAKLCV